ncbi:MAG TPA: hypothetical protein VF060_35015 [Trebonia sp.]
MSQHGSNSDRPRGRRARPGGDWSNYDAAPQEDREFPDLQPIRPREGRGRHSAPSQDAQQPWDGQQAPGQGSWEAQQAAGQPGQGGQAPWGPSQAQQAPQGFRQASPGQVPPGQAAPSYGQSGPQQTAPRHSAPQPAASQYTESQYAQSQHAAPPAGPRHSAPQPAAPQQDTRGAASGGQGWDDQESEDPMAAFSERWQRRGHEHEGDPRKRWGLYLGGGVVGAVIIAVVVYFLTAGGGGAANTGLGSLVTTFLPGELQQVPNACTSMSSGTLNQYLPGQLKQASPPLNTGAQSQCTWTLDNAPTYRVLEVYITAYSPSGLASGDGSATFAAEDAYAEAQNVKQNPGPKSGQSPAAIGSVPNLGSSAFSATQVFTENGAVMDMATVYVRYHNVIIQVVLNGMDHNSAGKQYGPVSKSTLLSQAQSVAEQVTTKVTG